MSVVVEYATKYDPKLGGPVASGHKTCPFEGLHTPAPSAYLDWHAWADRMAKTHVQRRCPGCTLFKVWVPK